MSRAVLWIVLLSLPLAGGCTRDGEESVMAGVEPVPGSAAEGAPPPAAPPPALERRTLETEVMGTDLQIEALGEDAAVLERAIDEAFAELRRVEDLMTDWRPSELTRLNDAAGSGPHQVPRELAEIIARSQEIGRMTDGAFDITFAAVGRLWGTFHERRIPDPQAIAEALPFVDARRIRVDLDASTVDLPQGMRIGLGGIAKGYGVERAIAILSSHGIRNAIVNAGGDLRAMGRNYGDLWQVAIRHPRDRESIMAVIPVANTCVVTSGDYERFFLYEGRRYHHIIDPRTGYPSEGCMSATIVAPDCAFADGLATAMCVLGPERGMAIVEDLPDVEAILVGMDGEVHVSTGLRGRAP